MKTKNLVTTAIAVMLIIIGTQLKISIGLIPITLQFFVITLLALKLKPLEMISAMLIFILGSTLGLFPIAGGLSGPMILLAPSFSFIIGFLVYSSILSRYKSIKAIVIAYLIFYLVALTFLQINLRFLLDTKLSIYTTISLYFLPFVITDIITITIAYQISKRIK